MFRSHPTRCPHDGSVVEPSAVDPMIGAVIAGRYHLEAAIGEGGIGRVYRARHARISRQYAIKVPFGELAFDEAIRKRLANEAEAASRVDHPNLVGVVDVGETEGGLMYLAMDLVEGPSLATIIEGGPVAPARALTLVAQIADGLAHAHARDLVHRDLKPDNVIVERDESGRERARVVDFGIALVQDDEGRRVTAQGMAIGTPEYMAPEQLTGGTVDGRTDLFALGLVLYELVAGRPPFDGAPLEVATRHLTAELPPIASRARGGAVEPRIEALVRWMTAKAPDQRPASAELVADEARAIAAELPGGEPVPRRRPITFAPLGADGARRPVPTAEAWSPIVVAGARPPSEPSAVVAAPVTGEGSARVAATIRTPSVPVPPRAPRALGSAPPPVRDDSAEGPAVIVAPQPATSELSAVEVRAIEGASDGEDELVLPPVPAWRRAPVVAAVVAGAGVVAAALALASC